MARADLEAVAKEKYPPQEVIAAFSGRSFDMNSDARAAYIQGRLDQAEADAQIAAQRPPQGKDFAEAFERFSMGLDSTNRSDAEAGFRAGWGASQRPPASPEVRAEIEQVLHDAQTAWARAPHDGKSYDEYLTDALLARWSVPSQPVYDEEKIARFLAGRQDEAWIIEESPRSFTAQNYRRDAAALVAALRSGELTVDGTSSDSEEVKP